MVIVLNALGLPASDISMIYIVDWFLDRLRTPLNVMGDSFGAAIVAHISENDLRKIDERNKINSNSVYSLSHHKPSISMIKSVNNQQTFRQEINQPDNQSNSNNFELKLSNN